MMNSLNKKTNMMLAASALLLGFVCSASAAPPIVQAYGIHYGGKVQYHYRVTNLDTDPVSMAWVGLDTQNDGNPYNNIFELKEDPSGMFVGKEMASPEIYYAIPEASVTFPPGGGVDRIQPEETAELSIRWFLNPPVMPGQTQGGMSVTLDKADATYLTSHVTLGFRGRYGKNRNTTVSLQRLDVTPPALTVTLSPTSLPETDKLVHITATINVKDDYDPAPEIKLDSIAVNEVYEPNDIQDAVLGTDDRQFFLKAEQEGKNPLGRIYTAQYSATDGSGNQSIATATVTVMRKQEGKKDQEHKKEDAHKNASGQEKQPDKDKPFWKFW